MMTTRATRKTHTSGKGDVPRSAVPDAHLLRMHEDMTRIRLVEERLAELSRSGGRWAGDLFPSAGQEAAVVGSLVHLRDDDWISPTQRELGAVIVRGLSIKDLLSHFAAIPSGGREGGAHFGRLDLRTSPSIGSTASNFAVGAGVALAIKLRHQPHVAVGFFGDGVMNSGAWHEAINFAAVMQIPFVMVCNNNGWAFSTPTTDSCPTPTLGERAEAYGLPWRTVDGMDVEAVYQACGEAFSLARAGKGAMLVEVKTTRLAGHSAREPALDVQKPVTRSVKTDVLMAFRARLAELDLLDDDEVAALEGRVRSEIADAVRHVEALPLPGDVGQMMRAKSGEASPTNLTTEPLRTRGAGESRPLSNV